MVIAKGTFRIGKYEASLALSQPYGLQLSWYWESQASIVHIAQFYRACIRGWSDSLAEEGTISRSYGQLSQSEEPKSPESLYRKEDFLSEQDAISNNDDGSVFQVEDVSALVSPSCGT